MNIKFAVLCFCFCTLLHSLQLLASSSNGIQRITLKKKILNLDDLPWQSRLCSNLGDSGKGVLPLKNNFGVLYVGEIGIGTPPQNLSVWISTTTSDVWVPSSKCFSSVSCYFHSRYRASSSSTYSKNGIPCYYIYEVSGFLSQDNVRVGDDLIVKDQIFIEVTHEDNSMLFQNFDGFLGLGFQEISECKIRPIWYNMAEQGLLEKEVFSVWLNQDANNTNGGELVFGGIDPKHYSGNHKYVPLSGEGNWQFEVEDFLIDGKSTGIRTGGYQAIAELGFAFIIGPPHIVTELNRAVGAEPFVSWECKKVIELYGDLIFDLILLIPPDIICRKIGLCKRDSMGSEPVTEKQNINQLPVDSNKLCSACEMVVGWIENQLKLNKTEEKILAYADEFCEHLQSSLNLSIVHCDRIPSFPTVSFVIGNEPFRLTPQQYVLKLKRKNRNDLCISPFQTLDIALLEHVWLIGNVFMSAYHTVFDFGNKRIGFAKAAS